MDIEAYYSAVRRLGLRQSTVPNIYFTSSMDVHSIPDATNRTPEQRVEIIEKLKERLGITPTDDER